MRSSNGSPRHRAGRPPPGRPAPPTRDHPHRIIEVGADRFGNGYLKYGGGHLQLFCNFVLGAPPEAIGAAPGLPEALLVQLALAGALPPVRIPADDDGRWPGPPGPVLDAFIYRQVVAAWWRITT